MHRSRSLKMLVTAVAALSCALGSVLTLTSAIPAVSAQAAAQKSAYFTATMTKVSDGTGHGTENQSFVNAQNDFEPGDNTPNDGIVSSGDFVVNNLSLRFTAAGARSVRVRWDLSKAPWLMGDTSFCYDGAQVKAEAQPDGSCVFTIRTGAVETMYRTLFLVGKDTVGTVRPGNQATLIVERVAKNKQGEWVNDGQRFEQKNAPVTVVSAPAADLVIKDYGLTTSERRPQWSMNHDVSGYFDIETNPLAYPGWSNHGASTKGAWWGTANVSDFPKETVWSIVPLDSEGNEDTAKAKLIGQAKDGSIELPKLSGNARLKWSIDKQYYAEYVNKEDASASQNYEWKIQILPDKNSFAAEQVDGAQSMLNMGVGGEPGLGEKETYNTNNPETSALKGYPYANNDWSRGLVTVLGNGKAPGAKMLTRPYTKDKTAFEDENRFFDQAEREADSLESIGDTDVVSQGAQVRTVMIADPTRPEENRPMLGKSFTMQDLWSVNEQIYDGDLTVKQGDTVIDPSKYTVYYTTDTSASTDAQCDPGYAEPNWVPGIPESRDAAVRGIRLVFNNTAGDIQWGDGAGMLRVSFVTTANEPSKTSAQSDGDGRISDRYRLGWTQPDPASEDKQKAMTRCMAQSIWVTKPRPISAEISMGLKIKAPDGTERTGTGAPGDTVTYNVIATPKEGATKESLQKPDNQYLSVKSVMLAGTSMLPTLRIPLPDGLVDPVSSSSFWKMEVRQEKNEKGKLQDIMYFTPAQGKITPEVSSAGTAKFEPLLWSARVSNTASGYIGATASMTVDTDAQDAVIAQTTSAAATAETFAVSDDWRQGAVLNPVTPVVEITEDVAFKFNLAASGTGRSGTMTTVLRMPNSGADVPTTGENADKDDRVMRGKGCDPAASQTAQGCKGLDGQWNEYPGDYSSYQGGTIMTKPVELATKESTNTEVLYAVDNVYSEDPKDFTWLTWDKLTAKYGSAPRVTALKLTTDFEQTDPDHPDYQVASSVGKVYVSINKDKPNHSGDKYVMWLGKARYSQDLPADKPVPTVPFPAQAEIVASSIEGTLWWDQDRSTSINKDSQGNPTEELISGVKVSLYKLNSDGSKASDTPIATQLTDAQGHYKFTELHSGSYVVEVTRNATCDDKAGNNNPCEVTGTPSLPGVQTKTHSYYNQQLDVDTTRSWKAVGDATRDDSGTIALSIATAQKKVDFGYVKPDPRVTLDKTQQAFSCNDSSCNVSWDVVVKNKGTEPITASSDTVLYDRVSSNITRVSATLGTETDENPGKVVFTQVDAGYDHTLALDNTGHIWAWGDNSQYELGDGTKTSTSVPTKLTIKDTDGKEVTFTSVEAGENHSFAIDNQGRLWGWGSNKYWRITGAPLPIDSDKDYKIQVSGDNETAKQPKLIQFTDNGQPASDSNPARYIRWTQVSSNYGTTLAVDKEGKVWSWGLDRGEAAGRQIATSYYVSAGHVKNIDYNTSTVKKLATGDQYGMILMNDGTIYNFGLVEGTGDGADILGRTYKGIGTDGLSATPGPVPGVKAKDIAAGGRTSYYIGLDDVVYATGRNSFGQFGNGGSVDPDKNVFTNTGIKANAIFASDADAVIIAPDDSVWGWGNNVYQQLGAKSASPQRTPVKLYDTDAGVISASISSASSINGWKVDPVDTSESKTSILVHTTQGTGLGLGKNDMGQLGNGTTTAMQGTPVAFKAYNPPAEAKTDPSAQQVQPTSEQSVDNGMNVLRTYSLPAGTSISPGGQIVLHMSGTVMRAAIAQKIHNQAWFSSPNTPYALAPDIAVGRTQWEGVPSARDAKLTSQQPNKPDNNKLNAASLDVTGNSVGTYNVCLTGTDAGSVAMEHSFFNEKEDSCDQVGNTIPAWTKKPVLGKVSGYMWRDDNKNGIYDENTEKPIAGQKVYLLDQNGVEIPGEVTTTNDKGYYEFNNLEVGKDGSAKIYRVRFEPVYRSEFTTADVNDDKNNLTLDKGINDSDASTDENNYGEATAWAYLTESNPEKTRTDAGVTTEKPWLAAMPHTGLGWWVFLMIAFAAITAINAVLLLTRKER